MLRARGYDRAILTPNHNEFARLADALGFDAGKLDPEGGVQVCHSSTECLPSLWCFLCEPLNGTEQGLIPVPESVPF